MQITEVSVCCLNEYEVLVGSWPWSSPWVQSKDVFSPVVRLLWSELWVCKVVAFSSKQETPRESKKCHYKPCESPRSTIHLLATCVWSRENKSKYRKKVPCSWLVDNRENLLLHVYGNQPLPRMQSICGYEEDMLLKLYHTQFGSWVRSRLDHTVLECDCCVNVCTNGLYQGERKPDFSFHRLNSASMKTP